MSSIYPRFLIFILFAASVYGQPNNYYGVKFNSKNVERNFRTSLFLNEGKPLQLNESFSISFDISFWTPIFFGPVLRIETPNDQINLFYNQHKHPDTSYAQIIIPSMDEQTFIAIAKKELLRNRWFNFRFEFNKDENIIKVYGNYTLKAEIPYNISTAEGSFNFIFGIKDLDNLHDFDVPAMSIRNILITVNDKPRHSWELNPFEDYIHDKISNARIRLVNPGWVYEDHRKWTKAAEIVISDTVLNYPGIAFDSVNSRFFIDRLNDILIYNLLSGKSSVINHNAKSPSIWNELFYDADKQLLYSYMNGMSKVSVFDLNKKEWIERDTSVNVNGHYFGSGKFSYPRSDQLYLLGGYGFYTFKKDLLKYNFRDEKWEKVPLKRNDLNPRAWFTFGKGFNEGEYLIYGGIGNESGQQADGISIHHDLYILNMKDSTIIKLNTLQENTSTYAFLFNDLHLDRTDSLFYFLSQADKGNSFPVSLKMYDLKTGSLSSMGNEFWQRSDAKWIYSHLHYSKATDELVSVIFDTTSVEIFTISLPLLPADVEIFAEVKAAENNDYLRYIFLASGIAAAIIIYSLWKRKKEPAGEQAVLPETAEFKNFIRLFGGLNIYDKEGKDITFSFSPKLKEIFLFILIKSLIKNHRKGITSEELSSVFWPDSSPENTKSNRGVAINKIRTILSSAEGIYLEFAEKLWLIRVSNGAGCDYNEYIRIKESVKNDRRVITPEEAELINGGEFLKGISYEWLESTRFAVNQEVISFLKQFLTSAEYRNDSEKLIRLCDIILNFDPANQDAVKIKIKTLHHTGRQGTAKTFYDLFTSEYRRLYDEPYSTLIH
jgi:DNA-binding SARP family transcriptional activator